MSDGTGRRDGKIGHAPEREFLRERPLHKAEHNVHFACHSNVNSSLKNLLYLGAALLAIALGGLGGCLVGGNVGGAMDARAGTVGQGLEGSGNAIGLGLLGWALGLVAALGGVLVVWKSSSPDGSSSRAWASATIDTLGVLVLVVASSVGGFASPMWFFHRFLSVPLSGAGNAQNATFFISLGGAIVGLVVSLVLGWKWWNRRRALWMR